MKKCNINPIFGQIDLFRQIRRPHTYFYNTKLMIETEIKIIVNRKSDIDTVKQNIINSNIRFPTYIFEFDNHYEIKLVSDYEEWELDDKILNSFSDYQFTTDLEKGREEIRLQICRYQSELSTDDWGRPIERPLNEKKFLIKKSEPAVEKFNPHVKVLFDGVQQNYFINIVNGINKSTDEKGFLLLNEFKMNDGKENVEIFKDRLYKTENEAFRFGYYKMQETVNEDFKKYIQEKKKQTNELNKIPRKVVRDFIKSCNNNEITGILKNLDNSVVYEKRVKYQTKERTEGIQQFEQYLKSSDQELCTKKFVIRSLWDIRLPYITIGVKYIPQTDDKEKQAQMFMKYRQISFTLNNNKITNIIENQI